jgi:4-hydroxybenzoate polyprenyltransferase
MVRWFKYTKAFLRLVRLPNLIIISATLFILRYFIVLPVFEKAGFVSKVSDKQFGLLVFSIVLIAAAGYVINDYFDRKTDMINRPGKVILGRILTRRAGMVWHVILNVFGVGLGVLVAYSLGLLKYGIVFFFMSGLLWFYSTTYKRQVLIGNLVVAFMVAMVPIMILLFELPLIYKNYRYVLNSDPTTIMQISAWIGGYAFFAFLFTLLREIVKDLEDFEGDFAFGRQTIPIAWGANTARLIVFGLVSVAVVLLGYFILKYLYDSISIVYVILTIIIPVLIFSILFYKSKTKKAYHQSSLLLKIIMLSGLSYVVINYFI